MLDGSIRHQQAMFLFKILPILRREFDSLSYESRVFRMNPLEDQFHGRCRVSVVLEDSKGFFGPIDFACQWFPAEPPCVPEPLSPPHISLAAPQLAVYV